VDCDGREASDSGRGVATGHEVGIISTHDAEVARQQDGETGGVAMDCDGREASDSDAYYNVLLQHLHSVQGHSQSHKLLIHKQVVISQKR